MTRRRLQLKSWQTCLVSIALLAGAACSPKSTQEDATATAPAAHTQTVPALAEPTEAELAIYRGSAIARQVCVQCHDIGVPDTPALMEVGAPGFVDVANADGASIQSLEEWMRSSHPSMPTFMFNSSTVGDLAAYVMSFRKIP